MEKIESQREMLNELSYKIWAKPEVGYLEYEACKLSSEALKAAGFEVEVGVFGVPTAIRASFGSGHPVIGLLGEYDALPGMSQKVKSEKDPVEAGAPGQGCGHNLLGVAHIGAAIGMKEEMEKKGLKGTVVFYGCPGEELLTGKTFMARNGAFRDLDVAFAYHPGKSNVASGGVMTGLNSAKFHFKGRTAHAGGDPHNGRSALDAVELMNIGVQFLREHMPDTARIHYSITDAGGDSPNVVQPRAQVLYMVRSIWAKEALALQERVDRIALAASMMTDTTMEKKFIDGCSNTVPNKVLEKLLWENFSQVEMPEYTEEEIAYAQALCDSVEMKDNKLPGDFTEDSEELYEFVDKASEHGTKAINDFLIPYFYSEHPRMGSTDVGDVSWLVPTAQINTATYPSKAPGHSWQNVSCGRTSIAHKAMLMAGKVLAAAAVDLMEKPEVLQAARDEYEAKMKRYGGYFCPVPEGAVPVVPGEKM